MRRDLVYYLAMARGQAVPTSTSQPRAPASRGGLSGTASVSREIGYWALLLLAFALPFDMERRSLLWTPYLSVTDLSVLVLAVAALALFTVARLALDARRGSRSAAGYLSRQRLPLVLLAAFLVSSAISTVTAHSSAQGLTWFLGVLTGAALWLALPLWLADGTEAKINRLGISIVAGAVVTAIIGFIEIHEGSGSSFAQALLAFKFGPSTMGPFLRLSATFSSANVAAMYLELALPFAIAGLIGTWPRRSRRWIAFSVWLAAVDVLLVALMLTYSRGALIGLLAAVLAMALAGRGLWRPQAVVSWRGPAVILLANLALVFGILALSTSSLEQLRFSTQNDRSWYQASYISTVPPTMTAGRTRTIPVTVENRSPLTWNGSSPHTYGLSYHWLHLSRAVVQFANPITWLSSDLQPGGRQAVHARVQAPVTPGTYLLVWDTVWKGTTWFGPRTGIYPASRVRVIEPALHGGAPLPAGPAPPPDIANLPTSPALDRSQIWSVAVKMIKKHPLFGLGPQGVRMNYMVFTPPDPAAPARAAPPHAHDLALEMLADWGVIGGGLFAVLLAVLWWPLLRRVATGHVEHGWELAVVGAAAALLGHELVDYFLTKQAIFVMLWLLCGLAATMNRNVPGVQAKGPAN